MLGTSLLVFLGAAVGSALRYSIVAAASARGPSLGRGFPWLGLLIVNLSGCVAIGAFGAWLAAQEGGGRDLVAVRAFIGSGLLGGYTSFSAISILSAAWLRDGRRSAAIAQVAAAILLAIPAVELGRALVSGAIR